MIAEKTSSEQQVEALRQRAHGRLAAQNKSLADLARANSRLLAADEGSSCTGVLSFGPHGIRIEDMQFNSGTVLEFEGSGWTIGAVSPSPGTGFFNVTPSELAAYDKVNFQVFFLAVGLGGVEIAFWSDTEYLGIFIASTIAIGGVGGSAAAVGKFRYA
jgi:hypothetical protein